MTLCITWRDGESIHLAADSRLTMAAHSYADVGIKVLSLPYVIVDPASSDSSEQHVRHSGEVGLCFAGSAVNSLTVKESVSAALGRLQHFPGLTDVSMQGLAAFVFIAYKQVSRRISETALAEKGLADMILAGRCPVEGRARAFRLTTDPKTNDASLSEVLTEDGKHVLLGNASACRAAAPFVSSAHPRTTALRTLRTIIKDQDHVTVGGAMQYGHTDGSVFRVAGEWSIDDDVHHWRGGVDFNARDFQVGAPFIPTQQYIDSEKFPVW